MREDIRIQVGVGCVAILLSGQAAAAQPALHPIVPAVSYGVSKAESISADGRVVVGFATMPGGRRRAFRWEVGGSMTDLGVLPDYVESFAEDVNADGSVVVGYCNPSGGQLAFRWTAETGIQELVSGSAGGQAHGVNGDGSVVVGWATFPFAGRRWNVDGETETLAPLPGGTQAFAKAVTPDGRFTVGYDPSVANDRAVRWGADGAAVNLGVLPNRIRSYGFSLSSDGSAVVGYCVGGGDWIGFRWTEDAGMTSVGLLEGATGSIATDISADGGSVVGFSDFAGERRAFLHNADIGLVDLNEWLPSVGVDLSGWLLNEVTTVNADGTSIAGYGLYEGAQRAWVVSGIPAPGSAIAFGAFAAIVSIRRRSRATYTRSYN